MLRFYPRTPIGIRNFETDSQAYAAERPLSIMIDDGTGRRFRSEDIVLRTWRRVRQFFHANHDVLSDPAGLRSLLSEGGLLLYPLPPSKSLIEPERAMTSSNLATSAGATGRSNTNHLDVPTLATGGTQ